MENKGLKNPAVIGIILGILIVGAVIYVSQNKNKAGNQENVEEAGKTKNPNALETIAGGTREKIKNDIKTPEPTDSVPSGDVAVPKSAVRVGEEKQAAIRTFEIRGEGGAFVPSTIVVDELDVIEIELKAVDNDYDIFFPDFGIIKTAKRGTTEKIQFQAYPFGEYKFGCGESCQAEGKFIVNEK